MRGAAGQTGPTAGESRTQVTGHWKAFDLPAVQLQIVVLLHPIHLARPQ
jgi:hypothetical protein